MEQIFSFLWNIFIFVFSLGVLVIIHELGHFMTAKAFGVYCKEFSIGMGPLLLKHKKNGGETQFSLRAIPIGGYVSMVGEGAELMDEDPQIQSLPAHRRLDGIARWKRAIIMIAGVTLNFVLAFVLFIGMNATRDVIGNQTSFKEVQANSLMAKAGLTTEDRIVSGKYVYVLHTESGQAKETKKEATIQSGNDLYDFISPLAIAVDQTTGEAIYYSAEDYAIFTFVVENKTNTQREIQVKRTAKVKNPEAEKVTYVLEPFGVSFHTRKLSFGEVISYSFSNIGTSSTAILDGLGQIFTKGNVADLGGPVAIFKISSTYAAMGIEYFLMLWGMLSVNVAIFNLLPFPGLDGWHFLVLFVEGVTRKDFPEKVKNIVSSIGILLLFGLMILLTFKDLFL